MVGRRSWKGRETDLYIYTYILDLHISIKKIHTQIPSNPNLLPLPPFSNPSNLHPPQNKVIYQQTNCEDLPIEMRKRKPRTQKSLVVSFILVSYMHSPPRREGERMYPAQDLRWEEERVERGRRLLLFCFVLGRRGEGEGGKRGEME